MVEDNRGYVYIMRDISDLLDDSELAVYVDGKPVISNSKAEDKKIEADSKKKGSAERRSQPSSSTWLV